MITSESEARIIRPPGDDDNDAHRPGSALYYFVDINVQLSAQLLKVKLLAEIGHVSDLENEKNERRQKQV